MRMSVALQCKQTISLALAIHSHLVRYEELQRKQNSGTNLTFFASIAVGCGALFVWLLIVQRTAFFTIYAACIVCTIAFNDLQETTNGGQLIIGHNVDATLNYCM